MTVSVFAPSLHVAALPFCTIVSPFLISIVAFESLAVAVTVFRAKARYDGMPVIPKGFVAININNTEVTTTMTFAADTANP